MNLWVKSIKTCQFYRIGRMIFIDFGGKMKNGTFKGEFFILFDTVNLKNNLIPPKNH